MFVFGCDFTWASGRDMTAAQTARNFSAGTDVPVSFRVQNLRRTVPNRGSGTERVSQRRGYTTTAVGSNPFAAGVAGVEVVPELDIVLFNFPAQEYFAAVAQVREIQQTAVEIFDDDAELLNAPHLRVELGHVHQHAGHGWTAYVPAGLLDEFADLFATVQPCVTTSVGIGEDLTELGEQRAGFFEREVFLVLEHYDSPT
jgi:hypothetical protein